MSIHVFVPEEISESVDLIHADTSIHAVVVF